MLRDLETSPKKDQGFDTQSFLKEVAEGVLSQSKDYLMPPQKLHNLCKKVDVVKKVYITYASNLSVASSKQEISPRDMEILFIVFMYYAKETSEYKFLNSALKILDLSKFDTDYTTQVNALLATIKKSNDKT